MVKLKKDVTKGLENLVSEPPPPPPKKRSRGNSEGWAPILTPKQQEAFDSPFFYVLAYGEKGSGKTIGLLHKLVRHCYENENALALILVRVKSMATKGGAWDKLTNHILPRWRDGNIEPPFIDDGKGDVIPNPHAGERIDEGLGIEFTDVKFDSQHNEYIWIENRHGGWSMVVLVSAPHANQLRDRMRGYEPSFALVDELTSCDSREYLQAVAIQVGRREGIEGPQQYCAACNPEGPSHWVYKTWWEEAYNPATDEWDEDYHKIHVPISDNRLNLPSGYIKNLEKIYRNDPIEAARMLRGEWIDRPSGSAMFLDVWSPNIHVIPGPTSLERILPVHGYPIIIGMDPGAANNAFIFMQWVPYKGQMVWLVFDEMVYVQRRIRYSLLVGALMRRIKFWNDVIYGPNSELSQSEGKSELLAAVAGVPVARRKFQVVYVSDNSAFNQYRAAGGSYDVLDFERFANNAEPGAVPLHKQLGLDRMRVVAAPKFSGSVLQRGRLVMDALGGTQLLVSAGCPKVVAMFNHLESEPQKANQPHDPELALTPRRSPHLHVYDALCNPILTASLSPQLLTPRPDSGQEMFRIGS